MNKWMNKRINKWININEKYQHTYTKKNKRWQIWASAKSLEDFFVLRTSRIVNISPKWHWNSKHQIRLWGEHQWIIMEPNNQYKIDIVVL